MCLNKRRREQEERWVTNQDRCRGERVHGGSPETIILNPKLTVATTVLRMLSRFSFFPFSLFPFQFYLHYFSWISSCDSGSVLAFSCFRLFNWNILSVIIIIIYRSWIKVVNFVGLLWGKPIQDCSGTFQALLAVHAFKTWVRLSSTLQLYLLSSFKIISFYELSFDRDIIVAGYNLGSTNVTRDMGMTQYGIGKYGTLY